MTKIHMETEDVRDTARRVDLTAGDLYFMPPKLRNAANSLTSSWQGGRAGQYAAELRRAAQILQRDVITLQRLSTSLRREVDEWEQADATHDFTVALPSYSITSGEGPIQPQDTNSGWGSVRDTIRNASYVVKAADTGIKLINGVTTSLPVFPVVGSVLAVAGGIALFEDLYTKDLQRYSSQDERNAARMVDAAFSLLIIALKIGGDVLIKSIVAALVASGVGAIAGIFLGLGMWLAKDILITKSIAWFSDQSVHDAIVHTVATNSTSSQALSGVIGSY